MTKITLAAAILLAAPAWAQVSVNVTIGSPPYYGYAPAEVVYVERYVPVYDVPRIFVVARRARVRPALVVDFYRRGGWGPVRSRFGVPRGVIFGSGPALFAPSPVIVYRERGKHRHDEDDWGESEHRHKHGRHR